MSKHATGIYSAVPIEGKWEREKPSSYQSEIDQMRSPVFIEAPSGAGTIETYTVCHKRGLPDRGIIIGRTENSNHRFLANTPSDPDLFKEMISKEQIGRTGAVSSSGGLNLFTPN